MHRLLTPTIFTLAIFLAATTIPTLTAAGPIHQPQPASTNDLQTQTRQIHRSGLPHTAEELEEEGRLLFSTQLRGIAWCLTVYSCLSLFALVLLWCIGWIDNRLGVSCSSLAIQFPGWGFGLDALNC